MERHYTKEVLNHFNHKSTNNEWAKGAILYTEKTISYTPHLAAWLTVRKIM